MLLFEQDLAGSYGESSNMALTPITWFETTLSALMRKQLEIKEMVDSRSKEIRPQCAGCRRHKSARIDCK